MRASLRPTTLLDSNRSGFHPFAQVLTDLPYRSRIAVTVSVLRKPAGHGPDDQMACVVAHHFITALPTMSPVLSRSMFSLISSNLKSLMVWRILSLAASAMTSVRSVLLPQYDP